MREKNRSAEQLRMTGVLLLLVLAVMGTGVVGLVVAGYVVLHLLPATGSSFFRLLVFFVVFYVLWMVNLALIALGGAAAVDAVIPVERRAMPSYSRWIFGIVRIEIPWLSGALLALAVLTAVAIASQSSTLSVLALAAAALVGVVLDRRAKLRRASRAR